MFKQVDRGEAVKLFSQGNVIYIGHKRVPISIERKVLGQPVPIFRYLAGQAATFYVEEEASVSVT